jgi:hypothetical protein
VKLERASLFHALGYRCKCCMRCGQSSSAAKTNRRCCCRQVRVKLERASMFHPDNARAALELLHVRGMPSDLRPADRLNILNTMASFARFRNAGRLRS